MVTKSDNKASCYDFFIEVRCRTVQLIDPLTPEDACAQSMADASPAKWHLAHTSWFYETFILENFEPNFLPYNQVFRSLFNSYYNGIGEQYPRNKRGLLTKPSLDEINAYAQDITSRILRLESLGNIEVERLIELGCYHEQQHQELIVMDVKHLLSCNPLRPTYMKFREKINLQKDDGWEKIEGGVHRIGNTTENFSFDNEHPPHDAYFKTFQLNKNLVSNGEYLAFIESAGYATPEFWLADGWTLIRENNWKGPAYWEQIDDKWFEFTTDGLQPLDLQVPVCHVSYYEANAYANWAEARLPTEQEWEIAAQCALSRGCNILDLFQSRWQWTQSSYAPYPGFRASKSTIGEYNGKFMSNQMVLRGSSVVTPENHSRTTYRNFFYPHQRWPFTGVRLCRDI
jgi:ergothioneine biosynthesis protein EgtB